MVKLKATGTWKVTKDSIRIVTNMDFCRYYLWLFMKGTWNLHKMQLPKYGGHIGVINPKLHRKNCSAYMHLNGQPVEFEYDVEGNIGGFTKGFRNFWLDVSCEKAEEILRDFNLDKKKDGFSLLHHTICNNKNQ